MLSLLGAIVLLLLGMLMLALEIYTPGGLLGAVGALFLIAANLVIYQSHGKEWLGVSVAVTLIGVVIAGVVGFAYLPRSSLGRAITLDVRQASDQGYISVNARHQHLLGREGIAETPLRSAGVAVIDGKRYDVVARNAYVEAGTRIRVVAVEGGHIVVRPVDA